MLFDFINFKGNNTGCSLYLGIIQYNTLYNTTAIKTRHYVDYLAENRWLVAVHCMYGNGAKSVVDDLAFAKPTLTVPLSTQ